MSISPLQHVEQAERAGDLDRAIRLCDFYLGQVDVVGEDRTLIRRTRDRLRLRRLRPIGSVHLAC